MIIPNIWENKKWQPNHQPGFIFFVHTVGVLLKLAYSLLSLHSNAMYQLPFRVPKPEVPTKYKDI